MYHQKVGGRPDGVGVGKKERPKEENWKTLANYIARGGMQVVFEGGKRATRTETAAFKKGKLGCTHRRLVVADKSQESRGWTPKSRLKGEGSRTNTKICFANRPKGVAHKAS